MIEYIAEGFKITWGQKVGWVFYMIEARRIKIFCLVCFIVLAVVCIKTSVWAQQTGGPKTDLAAVLEKFSQSNASEKNTVLATTGLQGCDFGPAKIAAYIIFGAVGFVAFIYGKKNAFWRPMVIGVVLMAYPYFVSGAPMLYFIGIALTALLYFWRE